MKMGVARANVVVTDKKDRLGYGESLEEVPAWLNAELGDQVPHSAWRQEDLGADIDRGDPYFIF